MDKLNDINLEKRASIYCKAIYVVVHAGYKKDILYNIEGIEFTYKELEEICHHSIRAYGNKRDINYYNKIYKDKSIIVDMNLERDIYYERLKFLNNNVVNKKIDSETFCNYSRIFKFNLKDIDRLYYEYIVDYLKYTKIEFDWINKKNYCDRYNMSFNMLLEALLYFDDEKDIIDIIDYSGYDINYSFYKRIIPHIKKYHNDDNKEYKDFIESELKNKLDIYMKKKGKFNIMKSNKFKCSDDIIWDFINSECNKRNEFCKEYNVNVVYFDSCVEYIKTNDKRLYEMYLIKINSKKESSYIYRMLCKWIINGFDDRKIDLLDLFTIPGFSFRRLDNIAAFHLDRKEYNIILSFINKCNEDLNDLVLDKKNIKMNNNKIVDYLAEYNIVPYLYNVCVNRLNNGIKLDDLVINMFNYIGKKNDLVIKERVL